MSNMTNDDSRDKPEDGASASASHRTLAPDIKRKGDILKLLALHDTAGDGIYLDHAFGKATTAVGAPAGSRSRLNDKDLLISWIFTRAPELDGEAAVEIAKICRVRRVPPFPSSFRTSCH